jgi:hypothetical protein
MGVGVEMNCTAVPIFSFFSLLPLPKMKEILYVQAGSLSNFTGTHFWNAQEAYFTYEDDEDLLVNHDISFREGVSIKVHLISWGSQPEILTKL